MWSRGRAGRSRIARPIHPVKGKPGSMSPMEAAAAIVLGSNLLPHSSHRPVAPAAHPLLHPATLSIARTFQICRRPAAGIDQPLSHWFSETYSRFFAARTLPPRRPGNMPRSSHISVKDRARDRGGLFMSASDSMLKMGHVLNGVAAAHLPARGVAATLSLVACVAEPELGSGFRHKRREVWHDACARPYGTDETA